MKIYRFIGRRSLGFAIAGMLLCNLFVTLTDFGQNHFKPISTVDADLVFIVFCHYADVQMCELQKSHLAQHIGQNFGRGKAWFPEQAFV
jgi:hypothetical protein